MVPVSWLRCFLAVTFHTVLWVQLGAVTIQTNVDTEEPTVIRSPARNSGDGFGWSAVFHEMEQVVPGDDVNDVLRKTRSVSLTVKVLCGMTWIW